MNLTRPQEPRAVAELLPAASRGLPVQAPPAVPAAEPAKPRPGTRRPWPHAPIDSEDPGVLAAESLWRAWWLVHQAGEDREAGLAMDRIQRHPFDTGALLMLMGESHRAREVDLECAIWALIELRAAREDVKAAEESGRQRPGAFS